MNTPSRFPNWRLILFLMVFVLFLQYAGYGQENTNSEYLAALKLVTSIRNEFPYAVKNDTNGSVVSLSLPCKFAHDENLLLISRIASITNLVIRGDFGSTVPVAFTSNGISYLRNMSNLTRLEFGCFKHAQLRPGVLKNAVEITQLNDLCLYYATPPVDEYNSITNLKSLTRLRLIYCTNFGDRELQVITNLPKLTRLDLIDTGVSSDATNSLKSCPALTHFDFREKH